MQIENYPAEQLKQEIKKIANKYLDFKTCKIFIFGSRVRGDNFPRTDIDIGIDCQKEISGETIEKIKNEIDSLPTLYKFDIVDFKTISEEFKKEALKDIEYVN